MPTIAVLDDRTSERATLMRGIATHLPKGWACVECPLERTADQYPRWLLQNHVQALVVDQVLTEQASGKKKHATFNGHEVVAAVRKNLKAFPIYIVAAYPENEELKGNEAEADRIFTRADFAKDAATNVKRLVRAATHFAEEHNTDLARLSDLSKKAASDALSARERKELDALQVTIGFVTSHEAEGARVKALKGLEKKLAELEALEKDISAYLKRKKAK